MPVSFHIGILPNRPIRDFVSWIARADELGFAGVWVADSQSIFRDAFMALTLFAEHTRHMQLATGVANIITRHPAVLAHSFATLDELSGGRAILGLGIGDSAIYTIGQKPSKLTRLEEVIKLGYPNAEISKTSEGKAAVVVFRSNDKAAAMRVVDKLEDKGVDAAIFDRNKK